MPFASARSTALVAAMFFLSGCSSTEAPSLAISAPPAVVELRQGETASLTLSVTKVNVTDVALTTTGLPAGVTATVAPPADGGASYTVTLTAIETAAPGLATASVKASAPGTSEVTATFPLNVSVRGSYSITAADSVESIFAATPGQLAIAINRVGGFAQKVEFSTLELPAGIEASFLSTALPDGGVTLSLTPAATVPRGTYRFWVVANSPGLVNVRHELKLSVTDAIALAITAPDPASSDPGNTSCTPVVTATATARVATPVKAEWYSMPFRVQYPGGDWSDSLKTAALVDFWEGNEILPGQSITKSRMGFGYPKPYTITMRFRYRVIPGFAIRTDSVVAHCM